MGWGDFIDAVVTKAEQAKAFGGAAVGGAWDGAVSMATGIKDLAVGGWHVATDAQARGAAMDKAQDLARSAANYGGRLIDDPATREQAWDKVQAVVGQAKDWYVTERDQAAREGKLPEFYGRIAGRGGFELGAIVVPAAKLGALGKAGAAGEVAADVGRAAVVGRQLPAIRAGEVVLECQGAAKGPLKGHFPKTPQEMTELLGVEPKKVGTTPDGTTRVVWEPNANTRIRFESHPEGLGPGDAGFNPRHHGEHYHVELKPDHLTWNQAQKQGAIVKAKPDGYSIGDGTGFKPGEAFPGL